MLQNFVFGDLTLERFRTEYLDRKPVVLKRASCLHEHINLRTVDDLLASCEGSIHTFTRVLLGDEDVMLHANPAFFAETQKAFVDRQFQGGATIKVEDYETRHPLMARICRAFEAEFGGDSYAMTFLTPPNQQGFGIHFDPVSSFITQLSGKKHWKVYQEFIPFPTKSMNQPLAGVPLSAAIIDVILEPGDLLYIPAGYPHEASCSDLHSLHMTVGLGAIRPIEILLFSLMALTEQHVELRQPIYSSSVDFAQRVAKALDVLQTGLSTVNLDTLVESFEIAYNANRPDAHKHGLHNYAESCQATPNSTVRVVPNKPSKVFVRGEQVVICPSATIRPGRPLLTASPYVEIPLVAEEEVRFLLSDSGSIRIKDIPGLLDVESKVVLARRMAMLGLVEVVQA